MAVPAQVTARLAAASADDHLPPVVVEDRVRTSAAPARAELEELDLSEFADSPAEGTRAPTTAPALAAPQITHRTPGTPDNVVSFDILTELRQRDASMLALQTQLADMTRERTAPPAAQTAPSDEITYTADEMATLAKYDPVTRSILEKTAKMHALASAKPLQERIAALTQEVATTRTGANDQIKAVDKRNFTTAVASAFPTIRADFNDPDFKGRFMNTEIPFSGGETVGVRLNNAWDANNYPVVHSILSQYYAGKKPAGQPQADSFRQPSTLAATGEDNTQTQVAQGSKPILKASLYAQAVQDNRRGRFTPEKFALIKKAYEVAEDEGRINYNT